MQIRVIPPAGTLYLSVDGQTFPIGSDGTLSIDGKYVVSLLVNSGYKIAPDDPITGDASTIPASACAAGMQIFDTVQGKPLWRNATNDHWVDATGAVVI